MSNVVQFPRIPQSPEHRNGPDRRRHSRGGRRLEDQPGFSPLVMLVGDDSVVMGPSEAVLSKLRFAVTISDTVDEALRVLNGLRPDVIVAGPADASRIRTEGPRHLPVLVMTGEMREDRAALIEGIRQMLRAKVTRI
jgi:CheY-like chemotaxis protein